MGETSDQWQRDDWSAKEKDDDYLLNNARLVSQVWFRGHRTNDLSLQPGLYRESTWLTLAKGVSSPKPEQDDGAVCSKNCSTWNTNSELTSLVMGIC